MIDVKDLIGEKFQYIGRSINLCWIGIGDLIPVTNYKGEKIIKAKYALHIMSNFRIWQPDNPNFRIGYGDVFNPCGGLEPPEGFDYDIQGWNFYDEKVKALQENHQLMSGLIVKTAQTNQIGDLKIVFNNGVILETFSDTFTPNIELWRLFTTNNKKEYQIVYTTHKEISQG